MSRDPRGKRPSYTVDVVAVTPRDGTLAVLLERRGGSRDGWGLPYDVPLPGEPLERTATRVITRAAGAAPAWMGQIAAYDGLTSHPGASALSIGYVGLLPVGGGAPGPGGEWVALAGLPGLPERHGRILDDGIATLRDRLDLAPVAFRLLPASFTLSELQQIYELLLGRRLHKASFRRALQAAWLVEPTDEWRSEGRGRPAQLYRYAPKKRRRGRRGVRFDLLGS